MSRLLSLLTVLLFVFDATTLVAARPRSLQIRSPSPVVDVSGLNTNAKRFSRGLTPIPPLLRRKPTGIDSTRNFTGLLTAANVDHFSLSLFLFLQPSRSTVHGFFVRVGVLTIVARIILTRVDI